MLHLPDSIMNALIPFRPVFHIRTWQKVQILLVGTILAPGKRTVTAALRVMGMSEQNDYAKYHHVLNRAAWLPLTASRVLLQLLLTTLDRGDGPLVFGIDETIERRWGVKIRARGIYRDSVRSSRSHFVKCSGLRWICLMWLSPIPWAQRVWALPFLTVLAPSARFYADCGRSAKTLTDWARQMLFQLRRWLPKRTLIVVADSSYAVLDLLHSCQSLTNPIVMITRLRLDAALYEPAPAYSGRGRPRKKGARLPTLAAGLADNDTCWAHLEVDWYDGRRRTIEFASDTAVWFHYGKSAVPIRWVLIRDPLGDYDPMALLCTDQTISPSQIVAWFVQRWQVEVTFEESRAHLGLETQRQWSDLAIGRTTPLLLGLFSWITLVAHILHEQTPLRPRTAAWYDKKLVTFSDTIAIVRYTLWSSTQTFLMSPAPHDVVKIPRSLFDRLVDSLAYAA
jgi:hypothetical protein